MMSVASLSAAAVAAILMSSVARSVAVTSAACPPWLKLRPPDLPTRYRNATAASSAYPGRPTLLNASHPAARQLALISPRPRRPIPGRNHCHPRWPGPFLPGVTDAANGRVRRRSVPRQRQHDRSRRAEHRSRGPPDHGRVEVHGNGRADEKADQPGGEPAAKIGEQLSNPDRVGPH